MKNSLISLILAFYRAYLLQFLKKILIVLKLSFQESC